MTQKARRLLEQALELKAPERVALIDELLGSLDSEAAVSAAWAIELRKRLQDIRAGRGETLDWTSARGELHRSRQ